jgi:hypothetical protein
VAFGVEGLLGILISVTPDLVPEMLETSKPWAVARAVPASALRSHSRRRRSVRRERRGRFADRAAHVAQLRPSRRLVRG